MPSDNARRAVIRTFGGPEAIELEDVVMLPPAPGEVRMRNTAIGLNFIDTYHRSGLYPIELPSGLGVEAAGVVEAVGEGVAGFSIGDRVCTFGPERGAYCTARNVPAAALLKTPDDISDELAAAALLKGCTVEFLVERCAQVRLGEAVLVHAAAGGVGLMLVQWLKAVGAQVIGTVSTAEKAALAKEAGADHVILYGTEEVAPKVRGLTGGQGVRVAFDGVGKDTWAASLDSVARRGLIVSYGNASGPVTGVALGQLAAKGSLFVTRPGLYDYYRDPAEGAAGCARMFAMLASGAISVSIGQRYRLEDIAQAHRDLEARKTTGSTIILP
ncbi:MAG: quinone oxidoreductase [Sphingomonadales bacterium]|jgi:NADPH2:quinone reductase|nr:quinone oxidoreductase [Sphingomonadales bacterium]MBK9005062.1 quinone oxidoreductase [Sphingomonadales bacterium]MBK9267204.1 quinone oxidoreductase [Sphingomonadales bacterium]MBP6434866.1 quinone oxidoreductase [Sphingorhabdus sp.]